MSPCGLVRLMPPPDLVNVHAGRCAAGRQPPAPVIALRQSSAFSAVSAFQFPHRRRRRAWQILRLSVAHVPGSPRQSIDVQMAWPVLMSMGMCPVTALRVNAITERVIGAAIRVHRALGPGLLESVYLACLLHELRGAGLSVRTQFPVPVHYQDVRLDCGYRVDAIVEDLVIVEVKAVAPAGADSRGAAADVSASVRPAGRAGDQLQHQATHRRHPPRRQRPARRVRVPSVTLRAPAPPATARRRHPPTGPTREGPARARIRSAGAHRARRHARRPVEARCHACEGVDPVRR